MMAVKVSGYPSLQYLMDWAASYIVDLGYVSHQGDGFAIVSPDDDVSINSNEDFNWFRKCVVSALDAGLRGVTADTCSVDPATEIGLRKISY